MTTLKLNNNVEIPVMGFGPGIAVYAMQYRRPAKNVLISFERRAWNRFVRRPPVVWKYVRGVANALSAGFTLLDYSAAYGDGKLIRQGIARSGVSRKDVFLTTRVSNAAQFKGTVEEEFFSQLKNMGTEYVDLLMFHWPVTGHYTDTWLKMIGLYKKGYCRALGVANCHEHHIAELLKVADVVPAVNQFEVHPLFTQKGLVAFCKERGIMVEAYTPIARFDDRLVRLPLLKNIGMKYGKTVTQVVLRWHIQNGVIPVVRTLNPSHQKENLGVFDFRLTDAEMRAIDGVNINSRLRYDPDNCDFTIL